jgi:hypothetical protein
MTELIYFLQQEFGLSSAAIALGLRSSEHNPHFLPITLWQYGLVSLDQLSQILDWLEKF